jgi:sulfhydrogenase subunit beta (sulfur reductase)
MLKKKMKKGHLNMLFGRLKDSHRVIGPKIEQGVIVLGEIDARDIPAGFEDHQEAGSYRLVKGGRQEIFSFSVGPDSFRRFLYPPVSELFAFKKSKRGITMDSPVREEKPLAFIEMRPCDLSALKLYDAIFLKGAVKDQDYDARRKDLFVVALNCLYPHDNCFCHSMGTGPVARDGFDIALTELNNSFLLETGTPAGQTILAGLPLEEAGISDMNEKEARTENCVKRMKKSVRTDELPALLYRNMEHPHWMDIERRDLGCGNCTQVCPTCFCTSSYDLVPLSGISGKSGEVSGNRIRKWDSCFSRNFARVHGGNFRTSAKARFRQWMSHKLAYTMEQFGLPGCVGCGRCITWCPAGIDITRELEALRNAR